MKCNLCEKEIENYNVQFHHLKIDESHKIDICSNCIDKFIKWQGKILSNLFPTKAMKKRYSEHK